MQFRRKHTPHHGHEIKKNSFGIVAILPNIIAITLLVGGYYFLLTRNLFPLYINYIYWAVNVLVSYNIIAASARSYIPSILSILLGVISLFTISTETFTLLSYAESWQLIILGIIGFIVKILLRL